jgi:hypothetical protein
MVAAVDFCRSTNRAYPFVAAVRVLGTAPARENLCVSHLVCPSEL